MASRNRVIYQSEGLYVSRDASDTGSGDHVQLTRIQSANYSYTINRQDVNQYGELARIDSLVLEPPTVNVDFSYYLTDGFNERALDFHVETGTGDGGSDATHVTGNFASGHLSEGSGVNIYVATTPAGIDLNKGEKFDHTDKIIGIGNCYLTDYSIDLSVGSLPTASVSMEGANVAASIGSSIVNPAVNQADGTQFTSNAVGLPTGLSNASGQTIKALRPGDITLDLTGFDGETISDLTATTGIHVQSATISIPLSRTPLDRLGSTFAYARSVDFPVVSTLSVSALMNETDAVNLSTKLAAPERNVTITMKDSSDVPALIWGFSGALVESESWSSSIGSNKSVDLTFSTQIGGPEDLDDGVFLSGVGTGKVFDPPVEA